MARTPNTDPWIAILGDRDAETLIAEFELAGPRANVDEWLGGCEAEARAQGLTLDDETVERFHTEALDAVMAALSE
ncbi:MAG: hypothetical protein NUW01_14855 [Gemmatimonadaceae bacterium]|nr:hypothetical protein [Gemmatimonadaceae bacterium]